MSYFVTYVRLKQSEIQNSLLAYHFNNLLLYQTSNIPFREGAAGTD
jgi:hypothetical protein